MAPNQSSSANMIPQVMSRLRNIQRDSGNLITFAALYHADHPDQLLEEVFLRFGLEMDIAIYAELRALLQYLDFMAVDGSLSGGAEVVLFGDVAEDTVFKFLGDEEVDDLHGV